MPYFKKVVDPADPEKVEYVEVADDQIELPEAVVKTLVHNHPDHRKVVDETLKRKQRIKALTTELERFAIPGEDAGEQTTEPPPADAKAPVAPINEDDLFAKFEARMQKKAADQRDAEVTRKAQLAALAKQHGLGDGAIPLLELAVDPAAAAPLLAKSQFRFEDSPGGEVAIPDKEALMGAVLKNLNLGD